MHVRCTCTLASVYEVTCRVGGRKKCDEEAKREEEAKDCDRHEKTMKIRKTKRYNIIEVQVVLSLRK